LLSPQPIGGWHAKRASAYAELLHVDLSLQKCVLSTLLSVAAREPLLCWPRLATRACCDRGACAESPVILRRRVNYMKRAHAGGIEDAKERIETLK